MAKDENSLEPDAATDRQLSAARRNQRARPDELLLENMRRLRTLVTAGSYSIYRMSADWRLMYELDSSSLSCTTAPIEDWVQKYTLDEDRAHVWARIGEAIDGRGLFELEHRVRLADGTTGWVLSRAAPILGEDGEILEWFGVGTDVTERRVAAELAREKDKADRLALEDRIRIRTAELKESRDLLEATVNSSLDLIQVFEAVRDDRGEVVDFRWILKNESSERHFGPALGEGLVQRNPGVVGEGIFETFRRVVETGVPDQTERRYAHEQFDGWFYQSVVKLGDGVATTTKDISEWKAAQAEILRLQAEIGSARLRESEERLRQFGEASQDVLWIRDAGSLQWRYLTPAFETIYGLSREEALTGNNFRSWLDLILPEDQPRAEEAIRRVREGEFVIFDYRIRRPADGVVRWLRNTDFPIRDAEGRVSHIGGIGHDLTEYRETELRLQTLMEGIPQLVWRGLSGGRWTWSSPQWSAYTGLSLEDSLGLGWLEAFHPEDRDLALRAWDGAATRERLSLEGRLRHAESGDYRWFQTRASPVRSADGAVIEWLGTSTDVDDLRQLQEHQRVLVAELQHRTRNLMGVVRSLADKTARSSESLDDFRVSFRTRLNALARVQGLLSRIGDSDRVAFDELVRSELSAMDGTADQVHISGPLGVRLRSSTVQILAMALHELATNAVKYGALGQAGGRLDVAWRFEADGEGGRPWLHIEWRESGVAMPTEGGTGQGRELIEKALPYQMNARTSYELGPDGVRCAISIPVSSHTGDAPPAEGIGR